MRRASGKRRDVTIEVSGDVLIWADPTDNTDFLGVTEEITNAPNDEGQVAANGLLLNITFLGPPALGEDLDTDFNKKLDDDTSLQQCVVDDNNEANDRRLVGEDTACASADTDTGRISGEWEQSSLVVDATETRSKLVVRTGGVGATGTTATGLIDGGMVTHTVAGPDAGVTIYARVQDAKGEDLLGMPVDFVATDRARWHCCHAGSVRRSRDQGFDHQAVLPKKTKMRKSRSKTWAPLLTVNLRMRPRSQKVTRLRRSLWTTCPRTRPTGSPST